MFRGEGLIKKNNASDKYQHTYTGEKKKFFMTMVKWNEEVIWDLLCTAVLRRNSTAQHRCQLVVLEVKKWTEWAKKILKEKKGKRNTKPLIVLKNSVCLRATELKHVEGQSRSLQSHICRGAACCRVVLQKKQIIPSEQSCSSTFPLHQFIQQHKKHVGSKKQITTSQLMMLAQQSHLTELPEWGAGAPSAVRAPCSTLGHLRLEMRTEPWYCALLSGDFIR